MKKQNYIKPGIEVVKLNEQPVLASMSTGTNDYTGGDEKGPDSGGDNEDPGAKFNGGSLWDDSWE